MKGHAAFPHSVELLGVSEDQEREIALWVQREFGSEASVVDTFIRMTMPHYECSIVVSNRQTHNPKDGVITRFNFKDSNHALAFKIHWG